MCAALLLVLSSTVQGAHPPMSIATGGTGGMYYPYGGGLASIWSRELAGVNVKAEVTGGSLINVIQVARAESDLGISMADVVTAGYQGSGRFPEPLPVRVLFAAYPNIVHILTLKGSGINSIDDFRGKRVSLGAAGSGTAIAAENVLTALDLTLNDFSDQFLDFNGTASALKDGTIDAGFIVGGLGLSSVMELSVTREMKLVPLEPDQIARVSARIPAYAPIEVPGGLYKGVDAPVTAIGIWSVVMVRADMPAGLAYALSCTALSRTDELVRIAQAARYTTREYVRELQTVPLHEGTQMYISDAEQADERGLPMPACDSRLEAIP
jgi:TRAP transporter TAXI family solute receptor